MIETKPTSSVDDVENRLVSGKEIKKDFDVRVEKDKMRKTLHALQPAATDKENLVGAGRKLRSSTGKSFIPVKNEMSTKMKDDIKNTAEKIVVKKETSPKPVKQVANKSKAETKKLNNKTRTGKIFKDISIQTESLEEEKVTAEDLTAASPSKTYWKILAERRRVALNDALEENKILHDEVKVLNEALNEARALIEVFKEMIGEESSINDSLNDSHL